MLTHSERELKENVTKCCFHPMNEFHSSLLQFQEIESAPEVEEAIEIFNQMFRCYFDKISKFLTVNPVGYPGWQLPGRLTAITRVP